MSIMTLTALTSAFHSGAGEPSSDCQTKVIDLWELTILNELAFCEIRFKGSL